MANIERISVPKDKYLMFKMRLVQDAELLRVLDDPNIANCVDLLTKAIDRKINNENTGIGKSRFRKKVTTDKAQFISLFKTKYYQYYDVEYDIQITSIDMKSASTLSAKLEGMNSSFEEYVNWYFDDYLPANKKLQAPSIKGLSSGYFLQAFKVEHAGVIKKRKKKTNDDLMSSNVLEKARELIRVYKDKDKEKAKTLANFIVEYTNRKISLSDFAVEVKRIQRTEGSC